jgi:protein tyrosine phosphatase
MREEEFERSSARLFDVPAHLYKQATRDALAWLANSLRGKREQAFQHETQLCFFKGFFNSGAPTIVLPESTALCAN